MNVVLVGSIISSQFLGFSDVVILVRVGGKVLVWFPCVIVG